MFSNKAHHALFLLFWCFCVRDEDLTRLIMLFSRSKQHSKSDNFFFDISLLSYEASFLVEWNLDYDLFSFFLLWVAWHVLYCVRWLCMGPHVFALHSPHGPFAYCVVYDTLTSIEPSISQFYGMLWSSWGAYSLP